MGNFSVFLIIFALFLDDTLSQFFNNSVCFCVTAGYCGSTGGSTNDGSGQIDIRIVNGITTPPSPLLITPVSSGINPVIISQNTCQMGLERCCLPSYQCGIRYPPVLQARPPTPGTSQAAYGAYPWQVVLLSAVDNSYAGSGVLIDHYHVLTVAHKVANFVNGQLKARLGEWDASSASEPIAPQEFFVARIFINPSYNAANLRNSIAILRLSSPVPLGQTPTITYGCLPSSFIAAGMRCYTAGWGKNDFVNGAYQSIIKEVDVPLVDQSACQTMLRATRLGPNFQLDFTSFICAGGEFGKDACVGDGGSPLMCKIGNNWFIAGLVAWGIGCGSANIPGVYINVANYINWIQTTTRSA